MDGLVLEEKERARWMQEIALFYFVAQKGAIAGSLLACHCETEYFLIGSYVNLI